MARHVKHLKTSAAGAVAAAAAARETVSSGMMSN